MAVMAELEEMGVSICQILLLYLVLWCRLCLPLIKPNGSLIRDEHYK